MPIFVGMKQKTSIWPYRKLTENYSIDQTMWSSVHVFFLNIKLFCFKSSFDVVVTFHRSQHISKTQKYASLNTAFQHQ